MNDERDDMRRMGREIRKTVQAMPPGPQKKASKMLRKSINSLMYAKELHEENKRRYAESKSSDVLSNTDEETG